MNEQGRLSALADQGLDPSSVGYARSRAHGARWQQDLQNMIDAFDPNGEEILRGFYAAEEVICEGFQQNFYNQLDDNGLPWQPRKDNLPHPLLIKTGRMFKAATDPRSPEHFSDVTDGTLETGIGEQVHHAKYHHWGTSRMVARRVIYATPETINRALEAFADAIEESIFS